MTKREMIRELRDVLVGNCGHSHIAIWKEGRSWKTETGLDRQIWQHVEGCAGFDHCCNEMTLKETAEYFNDQYLYAI